MNSQPPVIDAQDVDLTFSEDAGVHQLTLRVPQGTIFGLIGPSGCGKTTTVRLLTGVYRPMQGKIQVLGRDPARFGASTREKIGYMPQQFVLYPNLTAWENLNFVASVYGMGYFRRRGRLERLLEFVELTEARGRLVRRMSGGMQRRLSLACALVHSPALIFADEPTAGIDPVLRGKFWQYFRSLREEGRTLFVTTQYIGEAAYCDMIGVMRDGRLLHLDTPDGLRRTALGGEVIKVAVEPSGAFEAARLMSSHALVNEVRRSRSQPGLLYLNVEDAGEALPALLAALSERADIVVQSAEEYQPPFDDIFVRLMEQAEDARV